MALADRTEGTGPQRTMAEPIRFPFSERKATAAASLFLQLAGGQMEYLKLIKLLYYADRESLDRMSRPISGDRYVSMKHGPVLSGVYDLIKALKRGELRGGPWSQCMTMAGEHVIKLDGAPDLGPLSEADIKIITEVFSQHGALHWWDVRNQTHLDLDEWEDPGAGANELPIETILNVLAKSSEEIEQVRTISKESQYFASILGA